MNAITDKFVFPGDFLGVIEEFIPGEGTYEENGSVYSAVMGKVTVNHDKHIISVTKVNNTRPLLPVSGDIVFGLVYDVSNDSAMIKIHYVKGKGRLTSPIAVFLRFPYVSSKMRYNSMYDVVREGDLVKAVVLNSWLPYQVSTRGREFGVIFARCHICLTPLIKKRNKLFCPNCKSFDSRKISSDYGVQIIEERD